MLSIPSNDPDENPTGVSLSGTGVGVPNIFVSPKDFFEFPNTYVGFIPPVQTFKITNIGTENLMLDTTKVKGKRTNGNVRNI